MVSNGESGVQLELFLEDAEDTEELREYRIPGRTNFEFMETKAGVDRWIRDFHEMNGMILPPGYSKLDKGQRIGMMCGMRDAYRIRSEDIVDNQYFYK
jgi:hypothetical protein